MYNTCSWPTIIVHGILNSGRNKDMYSTLKLLNLEYHFIQKRVLQFCFQSKGLITLNNRVRKKRRQNIRPVHAYYFFFFHTNAIDTENCQSLSYFLFRNELGRTDHLVQYSILSFIHIRCIAYLAFLQCKVSLTVQYYYFLLKIMLTI